MKLFKLPKSRRFRGKKTGKTFFKCAKKLENDVAKIYFAPIASPKNKVAFSVRKQLGNAVQRNFCRRRLKEFYRQHQAIVSNFDLLFVAKKTVLTKETSQLDKSLYALLEEIKK
ncbi:ribonuclease P protein component [Candidatus Marinamargulisbacteria bacterium SCGC AG-439-L15]|nr:ribonuclease P protein component [Candidatus Marinamargulisbacteria bacterium SCGC AG-439-L15]